MLPMPGEIHPKTDTHVKDSCNCCNPIKIIRSASRSKVKDSDDKLEQVAEKVKETGSVIINKKTAHRDVREMW